MAKELRGTFEREKATKNTVRYAASADQRDKAFTDYIYVRNSAVAALGKPDEIEVIIRAKGEK